MQYKIAYLTSKDPKDKQESSGVYHYQAEALKKHCGEIYHLGPVKNNLIGITRKAGNLLNRFSKEKYNLSHSIIISKVYGKIFSRKLKHEKYDFVFADKSSCEIAYLNTSMPLIYSTDATFKLLHNYYPGYSNLLEFSAKESNKIEQNAINKASLILVTSQWAATSVINDYNFPPEKIHVIPRGANVDKIPEKESILAKKKTGICQLLYMGYEWYRKGYDVAYKTMDYIRSKGIPVKLVAIGCSPPADLIDDDVKVISYLDKNTSEGRAQFDEIMLNSSFYLLPTRAECMGIAFCESSAYGLPVITRDTGGVTEVVKNGINGYALDFESDYKEFGDKIISIFESDEEYYNLVKSSRNYFEERLNWDAWGEKIKIIMDNFFSK
ncbi:MAG: glycosyltransferase family 4 protein [Cyclobacteriaceae bacterium]